MCIVVCSSIHKYSFGDASLISTLGLISTFGLLGLRATDDLMCENMAEGSAKKALACELLAYEVESVDTPVVSIRQPRYGL